MVDGLGLLPVRVRFGAGEDPAAARRAARWARRWPGTRSITASPRSPIPAAEPFLDGCRRGAVWGTSWHGALENDEFRRAFLAEVAALASRDFTPAPGTDFAAVREARLDALGASVRGTLLVAGTGSDAGKSVLVAGLCRWLARQGVKVAPFKAQNMSLNSFVTLDGAEIGRAQAMQAAAAGIEPAADMNPVLLKPGSDRRSQVVVLGHPEAEADAVGYRAHAPRLRQVALDSLTRLRDAYDVVICEGAGSPAEINLRDTDVANMGLARAAGLPVIVVGDIDRGGVFAAMYGTLALLSPADQALISGFVINKFRGAPELLDSGLAMLQRLTGRPVYGVLPWREGLWLDAEDSLSLRHSMSWPPASRSAPLAATPSVPVTTRLLSTMA